MGKPWGKKKAKRAPKTQEELIAAFLKKTQEALDGAH